MADIQFAGRKSSGHAGQQFQQDYRGKYMYI